MLSQSTGYAISALGVIAAGKGKPLLIKDIANIAEVPAAYLGKIMHTLSRKGIIKSQRGIGGGVVLLVPPEDLSVYDICNLLDDLAIRERCAISATACSNQRACPLHYFWQEHRSQHISFFKKTTIAHIAAFELNRASLLKSNLLKLNTKTTKDKVSTGAKNSRKR
jgi:Rrf2 family iron-sulfur cluster assembly transcriptional regulator